MGLSVHGLIKTDIKTLTAIILKIHTTEKMPASCKESMGFLPLWP